MNKSIVAALGALSLIAGVAPAAAAPAIQVLGRDFVFPKQVSGLPAKLSDFPGLQINTFTTNDGVKLTYWEAGEGSPIIFVPGWSANGAEYVNVMYLLAKHHRVIVLDQRNQGLSPNVEYGNRIARLSMDLRQLTESLGIKSADYCGWSMGASVLWSYIDLFGTEGMHKVVFVDEPISIVAHSDWSEEERRLAGSNTTSAEALTKTLSAVPPQNPNPEATDLLSRFMLRDVPVFANSEAFSQAFVHSDTPHMMQIMYNHATGDWRDVLRTKIDVPAAIFTGEWSAANGPSQRWAQSVMPDAKLFVYTKAEQGDHFLMFKNPFKFTADLQKFLAD
ncbi:Alpha/beta hydrolase [Novosphingobium resinovorum]|uniref:Alpha/beta hydrolase n=1 Tax=Novosphingobium resinovorum TaxID=158500 RepID=A0A031JE30_9SPHN|nr:alpha/beta hydrolase [Novosphingobium resinovorum]EZP71507.1 Alpha/beta hydrolase [Novosphingobium resinovorum]